MMRMRKVCGEVEVELVLVEMGVRTGAAILLSVLGWTGKRLAADVGS